MLKGHRSQLEEASNDQIWANLKNKINKHKEKEIFQQTKALDQMAS